MTPHRCWSSWWSPKCSSDAERVTRPWCRVCSSRQSRSTRSWWQRRWRCWRASNPPASSHSMSASTCLSIMRTRHKSRALVESWLIARRAESCAQTPSTPDWPSATRKPFPTSEESSSPASAESLEAAHDSHKHHDDYENKSLWSSCYAY